MLRAYLSYFLPWNVYRLCRILPSLPLKLGAHDGIVDLGSGPLTLVLALWICREDLRSLPLEFRCIDRSSAALEAGKKLFTALTAGTSCGWIIHTIRGELRPKGSLSMELRGKKAALVAAVNLYNELFWDRGQLDRKGLEAFSRQQGSFLASLTAEDGAILVVEPGVPRSGEFISLLRRSLMEQKRLPLSPCPHGGPCPLIKPQGPRGSRAKWCHYPMETDEAPAELHGLSKAAGLPKERAVLSFVYSGAGGQGRGESTGKDEVRARVVSDLFSLGSGGSDWGRYACSDRGLVLLRGTRENLRSYPPGTQGSFAASTEVDAKSGYMVINLQ